MIFLYDINLLKICVFYGRNINKNQGKHIYPVQLRSKNAFLKFNYVQEEQSAYLSSVRESLQGCHHLPVPLSSSVTCFYACVLLNIVVMVVVAVGFYLPAAF